ncbi:MAG TPA: hydantoinase/oxoprolinase family protein [Candidatus Rubrimentiphilum sp.]|nr:hydantoinase/oxoprolinase family protein [Candidatus Rubrimentiphilum sp.]
MEHSIPTLRVGIDVGGTFTDLVAVDVATGERTSLKVSSTPRAPEQGVITALQLLLAGYPEPPSLEYLAHSTTIATNALLGQIHLELPRVAFLTTEGFRDVIEIGRQNRSEVYNLFVTRPKPLVARHDRIPVHERLDYRGEVLVPLEQSEIDRVIETLRIRSGPLASARAPSIPQDDNRIPQDDTERPIQSIAIGLLHSYANSVHERMLGSAIAAALPGIPVTLSSEIDPEYREYERFSTAVVNAALMPIVHGYLERLAQALKELGISAPLYVMQSNGGIAAADRIARMPAAIIESGPASGVIAAAELARGAQIERVLSFDMGGTSAKAGTIAGGVVHVAAEFEAAGSTHSGRSVKGSGYPVRFPFVDLAEISAGGGTIAWIDEARALRVGPISAGADPGPACYGRSDNATVTDANVVLGRLNQTALVGGTFPIDAQRSHAAIAALAEQIGLSTPETAAGIVRIVDSQMARVLRIVTVERGLDPREFSLVAFGGNGPLHACALAAELGISSIIIPENPGVFSAHGLLVAPLQAGYVRPLLQLADRVEPWELDALFAELESEAGLALREQGARDGEIAMRRHFDARYPGQSFELSIAAGDNASGAFHDEHRRRYGYSVETEPVELVNARVTATKTLPRFPTSAAPPGNGRSAPEQRPMWVNGDFVSVPVYSRSSLTGGRAFDGPAIVEQYDSCVFVAPEWNARVRGTTLHLERRGE